MENPELALLFEETAPPPPKAVRLKTQDLKIFCEGLSRLLQGGIPMLRALEALEKSSKAASFKLFLSQVQEGIREGAGFSETLQKTKAVPPFFFQILYAGEISGSLPALLEELGRYLEKEIVLRRRIQEALTYPAFILLMGLATLGVLLQVVIPKLAGIYGDFGAELPGITRMILAASRLFMPFLLLMLALGSACFWAFKKNKELLGLLIFKAPAVGKFFQLAALVQFSRLLSLLLESGVPVLEALGIVEKTFSNSLLTRDISRLREGLSEGRGFANGLEPFIWMDDLSKMLVSAGEESGRLASSFAQIGEDSESLLETRIQILMKLFEPALILGIGIVIGFVVIGTVLPIFDISGFMS